MSTKEVQIKIKVCDVCQKNTYDVPEIKFEFNRKLNYLGIDICEQCHQKYDIKLDKTSNIGLRISNNFIAVQK